MRPPSSLLRETPWLALGAAGYLGLALLAIALTRQPGNVASAWVAGAFLLALMLHRGRAAPYLVLACAMRALSGLLVGDPVPIVLAHAASAPIALGIAWTGLRALRISPLGLPDLRALVWPVVLMGVAGPALGGLLPALAHDALGTGRFGLVWFTWLVANSFGALLVLPVGLAASREAWARLRRHVGPARLFVALAGTLAVTALAVGYLDRPFIVASLPMLAAAFWLGRFGTALACAANLGLMVGLRLLFDHTGLAGAEGGGVRSDLLGSVAFNLYAALSAAPALVVSVVQAQRRQALERLHASQRTLYEEKQLAETTLNSIGDAVITVDPASRVTFMNPVAEDMTGWKRAEALGHSIDEVMRLLDAETGAAGLPPLAIAMRERRSLGLALNTLLVHREGRQIPVEDSAAPIIGMDNEVVGGVIVFHDVSESRAMALRMSHLAQHDYLTDLPNRVLLQDRLEQALAGMAQGRRGGVMFLDLDRFKTINDTLGHEVGDRLLQAVARRLVEHVREDDTVSRQGGDEFVILLGRLADPRDAARVAEKLITEISRPFHVDGHELEVGASIGIALFPEDGEEAGILMKRADAALYHAKENGRGRFEYYTHALGERAENRLALERQLRRAIRQGELQPWFQPKVAADSRWITGLEALVRWRTPDGRLVPPGEFIPLAEDCGLVDQVDALVMREAARAAARWQAEGLLAVPVSVNVSLARFDAARLLGHVREVLADTGLDPGYLQIEITETQAMQDEDHKLEVMQALQSLGVRIAMDDFGTGYSSIGSLQRFGFDVIKIDRSLVAPLGSERKHAAIVAAIVGMARAFECQVVAEGVESTLQAKLAASIGCQELQGFLFSQPVPAGDVPALLTRGRLGPASEPPGAGMK